MRQGEIDSDLLGDELKVHEMLIDQVHFDLNGRIDVQTVQEDRHSAAVQLDRSKEALLWLEMRLSELDVRIEGGDLGQGVFRS